MFVPSLEALLFFISSVLSSTIKVTTAIKLKTIKIIIIILSLGNLFFSFTSFTFTSFIFSSLSLFTFLTLFISFSSSIFSPLVNYITQRLKED